MTTVSKYLNDERTDLLKDYGFDIAEDFEKPATGLPQFYREMYGHWKDYYQILINLTTDILDTPWTETQFRNAIRGENLTLRDAIEELDDRLADPSLPRPVKRHLRILRQLLRIELRTNKQLLKQPFT